MSQSVYNTKNLISVITPVFNEESNIGVFFDLLTTSFNNIQYQFQWVAIDDCSTDNSFEVISEIAITIEMYLVYNFQKTMDHMLLFWLELTTQKGV